MTNKIIHIPLDILTDVTPVQNWLNDHPTASVLSVSVQGYSVYLVYQ